MASEEGETGAAAEAEAAAASGARMITLTSSEGTEFRVPEAEARLSSLLDDMIGKGGHGDTIPLRTVPARALDVVTKYCRKHAAKPVNSDPSASAAGSSNTAMEELKAWDRDLVGGLYSDALYDLLVAANFLDVQGLLDAACDRVADMIKGKTPRQIREAFGIANDFTAAEVQEIRSQYAWAFYDDDI